MPWSLYLALKQLFPSGRNVSFFSILSIAGVSLGVCLLIRRSQRHEWISEGDQG